MANQFLAANLIPRWDGKETAAKKLDDLQDYLYKLREGLEYELQNLDSKNFSRVFGQEQAESMAAFLKDSLSPTLEAVKAIQAITELMSREDNVLTIGNEECTVALVGTVTVNGREI